MTKVHGRDKKAALKQLDDSLKRLKTDVIDLWQLHEVIYADDPNLIFSENGAIEALEEAKKAGKVRFTGFTGHKDPSIFKDMLSRDYEWDTVQMPINVFDPHFRSFQKNILPILKERNIGAIAMKSLGSGYVLKSNLVTPQEALYYTWSQPVATIVSGMDSLSTLDLNIQNAKKFKPLSEEAQNALLEKTKAAALTGQYEPFKTSLEFDGWKGREIHGIQLDRS